MVTVTIPKKIQKGDRLVAIPKRDYEIFKKWQEEIADAVLKVERGRAEYKTGRTVIASSPRRFR
ncbi:hypothetical protein A3D42_02655 [Candidatus Nomurabacteria bacterium RIFCSPHIGHO2_02_FULL_41_18]|uniref:Uncharacterized protein n=1 Tax=Candidatus Nomurabacteria bacterium RIFCSPHIGHO2_02_FULL_41_18 TaxID=1801754 RepID=A0A1F6W8S4_9BACT|nr:MAG: hypothetical protein A3D42_02655 [Candidatus Nomurabacteria bacterium RIFCSPHIGHO2_02_FULL_41_18]